MTCRFFVAVAFLTCPKGTLSNRVSTAVGDALDKLERVDDRLKTGNGYPLADMVDAVAFKKRLAYKPKFSIMSLFSSKPVQELAEDPTPDAAYTDVDWVPSAKDAQAVIDKIIRSPSASDWRGSYRSKDHGTIVNRSGEDFIWLYTGSSTYASNVERCSRGAVAQTNTGYGGKIDEQRDVIDATALAMQFVAGLSAAIALLPTPKNVQHLFRGAAEPPAMVDKLMGMAGLAHMKFVLPGLASTTVREDWAIPFMDRGPCQPSPRHGRSCASILYEITTRQAKDVTFINPAEDEWILPPNREFQVRSITKITRQYQSDYYKVQLVDF